jgi:tetratricopeptide (TPR) repeat protein
MSDDKHISHALYLALAILVVFVASRFLGGYLFDNNWSFIHLAYLPFWYSVVWLVLLGGLTLLLISRGAAIAGFFSNRLRVLLGAAAVLIIAIVFQHDSFLLGGGNLRVAQIAQVPKIILRWYEFGSTMLVSWGYGLFSRFDMPPNMAAVVSWRLTAHIATAAALIGCVKLASELTRDTVRRLFLFVVMFVGPQTILYFGFVGVEPVVPAVSCWVAWAAVRLTRSGRVRDLATVWVLALLGVFLHIWLIYLFPAVVFLTLRHFVGGKKRLSTPVLLCGPLACVVLFVLIYLRGGTDFEFSRSLLFWNVKPPWGDYGLLSLRHIGDVVQIFLLTVPVIVVTKYLWLRRLSSLRIDTNLVTFSLMALAGGGVLVIMDPVNSIVFDLPRMVGCLTPMSLLLGLLLAEAPLESPTGRRLLGVTAALVLMAPMSYLPVLLKINHTESYAVEYFDRHDLHYLRAGLAFRDAYFYRRHFDERKEVIRVPGYEQISREQLRSSGVSAVAGSDTLGRYLDTLGLDTTNLERSNKWEWAMKTISVDYLNLSGANDLMTAGQLTEALPILYRMKAQRPYWAEARATLAGLLVQLGRLPQARVEIDTCLMLQPYSRPHHVNNYICYRDSKQFYEALKAVKRASALFPGDNEILTDLMIIHYRSGNGYEADTMATLLLAADSTLPYSYLIKGFLEDSRDEFGAARRYYERFIALAPDQPETERIKKRLEDLTAQLRED